MDIKYEDFIAELGIKNVPDIWGQKWDESQKVYPGSLNMEFLSGDFMVKVNKYLCLPVQTIGTLLKSIKIIRDNDSLAKLLWLNHYILFKDEIEIKSEKRPKSQTQTQTGKTEKSIKFTFPNLDMICNMNNYNCKNSSFEGMFKAILLISGLPRLLRFYKKRDIPEQVTIETLSDIGIWMADFFTQNGVWGLQEFWWLYIHFSGSLFRLGRLQFINKEFTGKMKVFRNKKTRKVISISEAGINYRADGQVQGTNNIYDLNGLWVSNYLETVKSIKGHPISPMGFVEQKEIELSKKDWEEVLSKGSPVLDVHIATGSKLSHGACGSSFKSAVEFYKKYFPEITFDGFMCTSWLLDPQFQTILPLDSNIVRFQRELYLYPVKSDDAQTFERVFGSNPENKNMLKAESSMQKAILDYINKGNHMHYSGMFLLKEDLNYWGEAFYQENYSHNINY